jgi:hypothetical protein
MGALALMVSGCCFGGEISGTIPLDPPAVPAPAVPASPALGSGAQPLTTVSVGDRVLANWQSRGRYYLGAVVATDGTTAEVIYADNSRETLVLAQLTTDRLVPGLRVEARQSSDTEFSAGTLDRRVGHAVAISYADGRRAWTSIGLVRVDPANLPSDGATPPADAAAFGEVGTRVLARYHADGLFYPAVVVDTQQPDGQRPVIYVDGTGELRGMTDLREDTIALNTRVETSDPPGTGTVARRNDLAVEVRFQDMSTVWCSLGNVRLPAGS